LCLRDGARRVPRFLDQEGSIMGKGDTNKSNKETKKPKKDKVKVLATANSGLGKSSTTIAGKKVK
jgi:predicted GTPase